MLTMLRDVTNGMAFATLSALLCAPTLAVAAEPARIDPLALLELERSAQSTPPDAGSATTPPPTAPSGSGIAAPPDAVSPTETPAQQLKKFGEQNSLRLLVEGGWINDFDGANMVQARVGLAWFFYENIELDMLGTFDYVDQWGPDAFGGGFDLQVRWHVLAFEDWSFFVEIGGGVLGTSNNVPRNGSPFNFTPNAGIGITYALDESTRMYAGAGWFHISNAGSYARNPGRENAQLWLGFSFSL